MMGSIAKVIYRLSLDVKSQDREALKSIVQKDHLSGTGEIQARKSHEGNYKYMPINVQLPS